LGGICPDTADFGTLNWLSLPKNLVCSGSPSVGAAEQVSKGPPDGTDQPLDIRVLPWPSRRGNYFLLPKPFVMVTQSPPVDRIAVAQKISAPVVSGKSLSHLLHGPFLAEMFGHLKAHYAAPRMRQHHEHKQKWEGRRRHHKEGRAKSSLNILSYRCGSSS
jgi:hypothetical protein